MAGRSPGTLIIIGGHEDKTNEKHILHEVARRIGRGTLVITTVASHEPDGLFENYERVFRSLGVRHIHNLWITHRDDARSEALARMVHEATAVFFTGGDQVKITSQIGDTPIFQELRRLYRRGGLIAGTSAGASVMSETMLVGGDGDSSARPHGTVSLAPGLGLVKGVLIDQHFAERGRLGRLLAAVAQNPKQIGIGIDEDTAIILERRRFAVLGSGAVYVLDGSPVTNSNAADRSGDCTLSIYDVVLHVLNQDDVFDLEKRRPRKRGRRLQQRLQLDGVANA